MSFKKYKEIEDLEERKRILKSVKEENQLFIGGDGYYTEFYFYVDNKFYNKHVDNYSSYYFPTSRLYEISFNYFLKKYEEFKVEASKSYNNKYKEQIAVVESFLEKNMETLLKNNTESLAIQIDEEVAELQEMIKEATAAGVTDEWTIYKNGKVVKQKKVKKRVLKPED